MSERAKLNKAWQNSIFAKNKFDKDLRRKNTVRDIYSVGYNDGHDAGYAAAREFYYPKLQMAAKSTHERQPDNPVEQRTGEHKI